jgi:hypothetical protein
MRTLLHTALLSIAGLCSASAQGVVVPNGLANIEGNSSSGNVFTTSFAQMLQVYSASQFGSVAGRVESAAFRLDGATGQNFVGNWNATIYLSTTAHGPDSLSPVFNDNLGPDAAPVFAGSFSIFATNTSAAPRLFEMFIPFSNSFFYDPSGGNLSMYMILSGGSLNLALDSQNMVGDSVGWVFGPQNLTSGTVDTSGLVTKFGFTPVPEPSAWMIAVAGLLIGAAFRRR